MNQIVYFTSSVERKRNRLSPIAVVRTAEKRATETKQSRRSKKKQNKTNKTIKKCTIVFEIIIKRSHYRITTVSRRRDASAARSPPFRKRTFIVAKFLRTRLRRTQKCAPRFRQPWLGWGSKWSPSPNFFYSPQLLLRYAFNLIGFDRVLLNCLQGRGRLSWPSFCAHVCVEPKSARLTPSPNVLYSQL